MVFFVNNNNKSRQRTARKFAKGARPGIRATRMQTKSTVVSMYTPSRISVPRDPPEVQNSVRVIKSVQLAFAVASTPTAVTVSTLSGAIPGGLTYWNKIRFQSIKIWANEIYTGSNLTGTRFPILIVTTTPVGNAEPAIQWNDQGTTGQQRPAVGFSFGLNLQSQWFGVADIQQLFTITLHDPNGNTPIGGNVRIQAVVEILSPIP